MTSQARIDANRHNAQLSTGPRTPQSKQASSMNATRHGFFARLLPDPTPEFKEMLTGLYRSLRPADESQQLLVDQIALAYLRLARLYQQDLQDPTPDGLTPHASRLTPDLMLRYETMLNRQIERNLKQLHDLQDRLNRIIYMPPNPPFLPGFGEKAPSSTLSDPPASPQPEEQPEDRAAEETEEAASTEEPQAPVPAPVAALLDRLQEFEQILARSESQRREEGSGPWSFDPHPFEEAIRPLDQR